MLPPPPAVARPQARWYSHSTPPGRHGVRLVPRWFQWLSSLVCPSPSEPTTHGNLIQREDARAQLDHKYSGASSSCLKEVSKETREDPGGPTPPNTSLTTSGPSGLPLFYPHVLHTRARHAPCELGLSLKAAGTEPPYTPHLPRPGPRARYEQTHIC